MLGYGICYIGGICNNLREVSELFYLFDKVYFVFGMIVGVLDEDYGVKLCLLVVVVFYENGYDE